MPLVLADRVRETTTTTGQGTVTLAGAVTGFQSFSVIGNGNTTYYTIAGQGTSEWEVGIGTYTSAGTTLSRDTVLASSAGAPTKTNFSAGTKDVFVTYPAERSVYSDGTNIVPDTAAVLLPSSGGTGQTTYTDGQLLIGNTTGNTLTKATLTQGTGITVTNGAGSVTVTNAGVTSVAAGTGISVSAPTGGVTITNAGVTSVAAGTGISVSAATGGVTISSTASGGGDYALRSYESPNTWTKPAGLKQVKVTVVGAGANGGTAPANPGGVNSASGGGGGGGAAIEWLPAPSIPGPVAVTAGGGTNSFGAFCSATAGSAGGGVQNPGVTAGGAGGAGSGGTFNMTGQSGSTGTATTNPGSGGTGGSSILGGGGRPGTGPNTAGGAGGNYGGGGGGSANNAFTPGARAGGTGAPGIVIVEEFY